MKWLERLEHWRKTAEHVLDGGAVGEYNGDPDSNVMELARAVQRMLDERAKFEKIFNIIAGPNTSELQAYREARALLAEQRS